MTDMHKGEFFVVRDGEMINVPVYETLLEQTRLRFEAYENEAKRLREKVRDLEDEAYADKRLAEMQEKVDKAYRDLARGFDMSEEETQAVSSWQRQHLLEDHGIDMDENPKYGGAIGGGWTFMFTPTSIGVIGKVRCHCGKTMTFRELG